MDIRRLQYFLCVAREGSMTKAAVILHVSQPTLSRQIKELELEMGSPLFHRGNYNLHLTQQGKILRTRAQEIIELVEKTKEEFRTMDEAEMGDIRIGCPESDGLIQLFRQFKGFWDNHPNIRIHMYSSGTDVVRGRLEKGLVDFGFLIAEPDSNIYNYLRIPYDNHWGMILRKDDPLAKKSVLTMQDICSLPIICSRQGLKHELPRWMGEWDEKLHVVATFDLLYNVSSMVREGYGYALGFESVIYTERDPDLCFRPLEPALCSPCYIAWKKHQTYTPAMELVIEALTEVLSSRHMQ